MGNETVAIAKTANKATASGRLSNERADGNWTNAFDGLHDFNLAGSWQRAVEV